MADKGKQAIPLEGVIALNVTSGCYVLGFLVALLDIVNGYFFFSSSDYAEVPRV